jgi:hypothetical protein
MHFHARVSFSTVLSMPQMIARIAKQAVHSLIVSAPEEKIFVVSALFCG